MTLESRSNHVSVTGSPPPPPSPSPSLNSLHTPSSSSFSQLLLMPPLSTLTSVNACFILIAFSVSTAHLRAHTKSEFVGALENTAWLSSPAPFFWPNAEHPTNHGTGSLRDAKAILETGVMYGWAEKSLCHLSKLFEWELFKGFCGAVWSCGVECEYECVWGRGWVRGGFND